MEQTIDIKGMHCNSCVELIESKISPLKGIENIKVSLAENKAFVKFNPEIVSLDKIKSEIQSLGYSIDGDNKTEIGKKRKGIAQGIAYGLIPHIGCIAFIIASVLGVTVATEFFKPLLLNPYFFYILIGISFAFATISSAFYLKKNGLLSSTGIKRKWKYLSTMYGSTIGINLLLFLFIFPLLANVSFSQPLTGNFLIASANNGNSLSSIRLGVDIPCSGHAPLISEELKKIDGVLNVQFSLPNIFDVRYDSSKTSKQQILSLEVFKTYKATVLSESDGQASSSNTNVSSDNKVPASGSAIATGTDNVQIVQLSVKGASYYPNPIRVKKGILVRLVADMNSVKGCSRSIVIPKFGLRKVISTTDNTIEFIPNKSGTFQFSCSMGMYRGQIVVEEADGSVSAYTESAPVPSGGSCKVSGSGCGCGG